MFYNKKVLQNLTKRESTGISLFSLRFLSKRDLGIGIFRWILPYFSKKLFCKPVRSLITLLELRMHSRINILLNISTNSAKSLHILEKGVCSIPSLPPPPPPLNPNVWRYCERIYYFIMVIVWKGTFPLLLF